MCRPPSAARESPLVAELYHIEAGRMFVFLCLPLVDAMYVAACQSVVCLVAGSLTVASLVCTYSMSRNLRCMYLDMDIISVFPSRSLLRNHPFSAVYICSHCKSYLPTASLTCSLLLFITMHFSLPTHLICTTALYYCTQGSSQPGTFGQNKSSRPPPKTIPSLLGTGLNCKADM